MQLLDMPDGYTMVITKHHMSDEPGAVRMELQKNNPDGSLPGYGEVAYWHPDGTNDIMKGEKGTMGEAAQALVDFTVKP